MKRILLITVILGLCFGLTYAQNERPSRSEYTLKLPVDSELMYEQKVEVSPYFVKENVLQIYPGERLFIEVKASKKEIISMKVVKENLNPNLTIEVELTQSVKDGKGELMMLKIVNPFKKDLKYKAMMFIVGQDKWINTTVLPVKSKLTGYETWMKEIHNIKK
ncbi:MAG: hypothetical protein COB85_01170 [Bacteroidetes bacterium]|nr:MAG: hypothetical protein COB85_01170 [Bacteroidota bacterium]